MSLPLPAFYPTPLADVDIRAVYLYTGTVGIFRSIGEGPEGAKSLYQKEEGKGYAGYIAAGPVLQTDI